MSQFVRMTAIGLTFFMLTASGAHADGGIVRASREIGDYNVTVFSDPTPLRVGPADISVFVQERQSKGLVLDADIWLELEGPVSRMVRKFQLSRSAATNQWLQAATIELTRPGTAELTVHVSGPEGSGSYSIPLEVVDALPSAWQFWPWIALPFLFLLIAGLREWLILREGYFSSRQSQRSESGKMAPP